MTDTLSQWHLHVTVDPHSNWTLRDVASALERDVIHHGMSPIVITNHFRDPSRSYKEIIPTKHFSGTEAEATRELFNMGVTLNNRGWRVRRLKIEGDPNAVRQRALYYETHIKIYEEDIVAANHHGFAISSSGNAAKVIATCRHPNMGSVCNHITKLFEALYGAGQCDYPTTHIEAAVLDTAPEMDEEWMHQ